VLAALLAGFLIFSGGDGFAAKMFGKETRAQVRQVVSDPERADSAVLTLELGQQDLEAIGKKFATIVKDFSEADEDQVAGFDDLLPYLQMASEQRRVVQERSLDRMFDLRRILTEAEWDALYEGIREPN